METFIELKPGQKITVTIADGSDKADEQIIFCFYNPAYVFGGEDDKEMIENTRSVLFKPVEVAPPFRVLSPEPELSQVQEPKQSKYRLSISEKWTEQERLVVIAALSQPPVAKNAMARIFAVTLSPAPSLQQQRTWIMGEEIEDAALARS